MTAKSKSGIWKGFPKSVEGETVIRPNIVVPPQPSQKSNRIYVGSQMGGAIEIAKEYERNSFLYETAIPYIPDRTGELIGLDINNLLQKVSEIPILEKKIDKLTQQVSDLTSEEEPSIIYIKQMTKEDAKEKIKDYFDEHSQEDIFPSELSEKLCVDYELVWEIIKELVEEGNIETGE